MSIPKSKTNTCQQQPLVSDHDCIQPLREGEVQISDHSRHGVGPLASNQGILRPAPWPGVRQLVPDGQQPEFPSVLPLSNTVPSPGSRRMSGLKQSHHLADEVVPLIFPDSYSGSDEEYGVDTFEPAPLIPPNSLSSDDEYGVDPPELRGVDNPHGRLPASYELLGPDSLSSNKPSEVGAPPGKRQWPFAGNVSPVHLTRLHDFTLPMPPPRQLLQPLQPPEVRIDDLDKFRGRLVASSNPQKLTPKASEPPKSRHHLVDELATACASSSGDPMDLDSVAFVDAVKKVPWNLKHEPLRALAGKSSFEKKVEFVKTLEYGRLTTLLKQSRKWKAGNPKASQVVVLLLLFTTYTPASEDLDEFMRLLPRTWPPALEHLRKACLDARAALHPSGPRKQLLARLRKRYGAE